MPTELVECVPNFSEGRDRSRLDPIVAAVAAVDGVVVLDLEMDPDHNRSVLTFAGTRAGVAEAAFRAAREARERIDLNRHEGAHPRMGAVDVIPFVPLEGVTLDDCVALARAVGKRIGDELEVPVFLYEDAATRPERRNLADVRKGEFEGLREAIGQDPSRTPDFGPARIHPTAGATAVGARTFLVAYNVNLATADIDVANKIARAVRHLSGGFRFVKAMGVELKARGIVQVSMNMTDFTKTPLHRVFEAVKREAERYGVAVVGSEVVGLVPGQALADAAEWYLRLERFSRSQEIETRLREVATASEHRADVGGFADRIAARTPTPGGGSAAALAGALAAALATMAARFTLGKAKYAAVEPRMRAVEEDGLRLKSRLLELVEEDAASYDAVLAAMRLPRGTDPEKTARDAAVREATLGAALVPLETMRTALEALKLAAEVAANGNQSSATDAAVGVLLSRAAIEAAALNVEVNLTTLAEADGRELRAAAGALRAEAQALEALALEATRARIAG